MTRLGDLLRKQGHFLLENDYYALLYIVICALIPFTAWLSAAIVALVTLRKGWLDGFRGLAFGISSLLILSLMSMPLFGAFVTTMMAFLPCYLAAVVLRATASWRITGGFIVLQALLGIILIHWLTPEFITAQYQYIQVILKQLEADSSVNSLLDNQNQVIFSNYLVGIQVVSVVVSTLVSLMLARSVQARIFYPGGYKQEMLNFRASGWGVALLILVAIGAYQYNPIALSCLPVLVLYYVCAGLSLSFNILAKGRGISTLLLLVIPLVLVPFVMLPVYVIFGVLDSLFNFRIRLQNVGGK